MGRYRNIDVRVWNDEQLEESPLHRLVWFALLTHPLMTPMGAGCLRPETLDGILGHTGDWCWKCSDNGCREHRGETILEWFAERSMVLWGNPLVILPNFLLYNRPQNPNQLAGWIEVCEELPRSEHFASLRDHLRRAQPALPEWLFAGLLDPLAAQQHRGLRALIWDRMAPYLNSGEGASKPSRKGSLQGSPQGSREGSPKQE